MTTNFAWSNARWRSISGRVPLPIEPKPSITIGPSKRASTSDFFIGIAPVGCRVGSGGALHQCAPLAAFDCEKCLGAYEFGLDRPSGTDRSTRTGERAGLKLK